MASIETQTKIALISKSLILCGEPPLSSLADERYGAIVGANLFEIIYENELQTGTRWRFACGKIALSRLTATPLNEYQYVYQLPPTMLLPIGVQPRQSYEIYADRVYTNATSFELEYLFKPDISRCPAYFTLLLCYALAKNSIKPITESATAKAQATQDYNTQLAKAQFADAQGRPPRPIADSPFTQVRG